MINKNNYELNGKIALIESKADILESALSYLNEPLIKCGFSERVHTEKDC